MCNIKVKSNGADINWGCSNDPLTLVNVTEIAGATSSKDVAVHGS